MLVAFVEFISDGIHVIGLHHAEILAFWILLLGLGLLGDALLPVDGLSVAGKLGLVAGLGCVWFSFGSLVFSLLGRMLPGLIRMGGLALLGMSLLGLLAWMRKRGFQQPAWNQMVAPLVFFLVLVLVRMAFVHDLLMPPYNDSPEHYRLVEGLLSGRDNLLRNYYHIGFHAMAAVLVSLGTGSIASVMPVIGQSFLILAPFTIMGLLEVVTGDRRAAGFGALLAGIGWSMPAFAANWGKYPALGALSALPVVLVLMQYLNVKADRGLPDWVGFGCALVGLVVLHSRIVVVAALFALAWFVASRLERFPGKSLPAGLMAAMVAACVLYLYRHTLVQFYCNDWCILLILVCTVLPFACYKYPRVSIASAAYLLAAWMAWNIPLPAFFQVYSRTVLDRTFIEISSFLPISILGAAGMAGIVMVFKTHAFQRSASVVLGGLVVMIFITNPGTRPDPCCNYVRAGDLQAFDWIRTHTPRNAVVVISSFQTRNYRIGTDAGAWVEILTGRSIRKRSYDLDWDTAAALEASCKDTDGEVFVYAGSMPFSFRRDDLDRDDAFQLVLESGSTNVYRVPGCAQVRP